MIRSLAVFLVLGTVVLSGCSSSDNPADPSASSPGQRFLFVNPLTGSDVASGSQSAPLKSIHKAFSLFRPGIQIELQAGTYSTANGQVFPDSLPSGVLIESVSAGQAVLLGTTGEIAFYGSGADTLKYVQLQGFNTCIRAGTGSHVLFGCGLTSVSKTFDLYGAAEGKWESGTGVAAVLGTAKEFSRIVVANCQLSGTSTYSIIQLSNAARASITGTTVKDSPTTVVEMLDASVADINASTFTNTGLHGQGSSTAFSLRGTAHLTIIGSTIAQTYGPAISMESPTALLTLNRVYLDRNAVGSNGATLYLYGSASIDSTTITNSGQYGIVLSQGGFVIRHSEISGAPSQGISVSGGVSLTLRSTSVNYAGIGVHLVSSTSLADLGTAADPGGNTFRNNTKYGIQSDVTAAGSSVQAVGNTWTPNVQGADANGRYAAQTVSGPSSATTPQNYYITGAGRSIQF